MEIYMQGLNQMSKKKQKVSCLHLVSLASSAINMFYKQIILHRGLPFEVKIPSARPVDISTLSEAEFDAELEKGYDLKQSFIYDRLLFSYSKLKRKD